MNKMTERKKAKGLLLANLVVQIAILEHKQKNSSNTYEAIQSIHQAAHLNSKLNNVKSINWKILTTKGKIDKRRLRRFATKHKPATTPIIFRA